MATQTILTVEQYLGLPEQEGVIRELDEGRIVEMSPTGFPHGIFVARIAYLLLRHVERTGAPYWVAEGPGFRLGPATVRIPDAFLKVDPGFGNDLGDSSESCFADLIEPTQCQRSLEVVLEREQ